ncbi:MAG TPA: hypothetical protein VNA11_01715, partial [Pseudonocardia sp.]|nr:hypothetical protein [Pseudonocardia sp.]
MDRPPGPPPYWLPLPRPLEHPPALREPQPTSPTPDRSDRSDSALPTGRSAEGRAVQPAGSPGERHPTRTA